MADLGMVLASLGGKGASVFQATVDAVGEGVLTIHANGGTFTDVPYLMGGWPISDPAIGDTCYVLAQENWGMLVLGRPAPGPERTPGGGSEVFWEPSAIGISKNSGGWIAPVTDDMAIQPGSWSGTTAVYFYDLGDVDWPGGALATASFFLEISAVDTGGEGVDHAYLTVGLHTADFPGDTYTEMANLSASYRVATWGSSAYVSIPLDWAGRLLSGEARGVFVRTEDYPLTVSGPGTLRLTEL